MCLCAVLLVGCSAHGGHSVGLHPVDELNRKARVWQYRDLDSAYAYAMRAYDEAGRYLHGRIVACNVLGFVACMQMDYEEALHWYDEVDGHSGCELERLVADVGRMNVYQRTADNQAFYDSRVRATKRLRHINEEASQLSPAERARLQSTINDFYMVTALQYYMVGQRAEAREEMAQVVDDDALRADSAQRLMCAYLKGVGLDAKGENYEERLLNRYSSLNACLRMGRVGGYDYFMGLALSGLSELLADSVRVNVIARQRPNSLEQLGNSADMAVGISMDFANRALGALERYGDQYGVVNAMVQMASLYNRRGDYAVALDTLQQALHRIAQIYSANYLATDSVVQLSLFDAAELSSPEVLWLAAAEGRTIPDAICRLREEASLAFAGLGNKVASDYNRNIYLDLLEMTRQDKEVEVRYLQLKRQRRTMNLLLGATVGGAILLVVLVLLLAKRRKHHKGGYEQQLRGLVEEAEKRVYVHQKHIDAGKRDNIVRKASFSIVTGIMPYVDRMAHEIERLQQPEVWADAELRARKLEYIGELATEINNLNEILSRWIVTTQGMVQLHVESFDLSEVFAMVERGGAAFALKGLKLDVQPTDAVVKADKMLTFFMLNTLADNARKFTPEGGTIRVAAEVCEEYVELSVEDNGVGMSDEDVKRILNEKVYDAASIGRDQPLEQRKNKGGGFGLLNCKGIIEKYRKTDTLFDVCRMGIDSRVGEGSRFWFRLPKGARRMLALLLLVMGHFVAPLYGAEVAPSDSLEAPQSPLLMQASAYADSVYFANVDGRYEEALVFADSALRCLNAHHREHAEVYIDTLTVTRGKDDVEIRWWVSDYATDYYTLLDIRNELAVANLALRRWHDYRYNNRIYNDLYKLVSEDRTLADYCNRMQRYNSNILVAVLICVLLVLGVVYVLVSSFVGRVERVCHDIESVEDEERRARHEENRLHVQNMVLDNCLSTIKHETIYYPNRIRQLVKSMDEHKDCGQIKELVDYYKVIFATLTGCASRQLDEVTFRRAVVPAGELLQYAVEYHAKRYQRHGGSLQLAIASCEEVVLCDVNLVHYLLEQLMDAMLSVSAEDCLELRAELDGEFVRFSFTDTSRQPSQDTLQTLFYPTPSRIGGACDGRLQGAEYVICRQIIREHDSYFNHVGCRIKAEAAPNGYVLWFTLPTGSKAILLGEK